MTASQVAEIVEAFRLCQDYGATGEAAEGAREERAREEELRIRKEEVERRRAGGQDEPAFA